MHCRILMGLVVLLTPAMAEWPLVTSVPAPLTDRPPAIAVALNSDIVAASADRVLRANQDGQILWSVTVPLEQTVALTASADGGVFAAGWTGAASYVIKIDGTGSVSGTWPVQGQPAALAVDATGSLYISGSASEGFTPTPGAWKTSFGARRCTSRHGEQTFACSDAFVIKMRPDGTAEWATLLGGTWTDAARSIAIDADGGVWIAGETLSDDFATTPNAVKRNFGGIVTLGPLQYGDGFVARLDRTGSRLLYATYLGGSSVDYATAIAAVQGAVVVTGATQSSDFPVSANAAQTLFSGDSTAMPNGALDAFLVQFSNSGERLYSSYFGIRDWQEYGTSVAVSGDGMVGVALTGRPGSCMLRYEVASHALTEECWKLALNNPLALAFVKGMWVAAGRTMQGHEVPGVNPVPRLAVAPLRGFGDNSGPVVVGLWNEYIPVRRPLAAAGSVISIYLSGIGRAGSTGTSVRIGQRNVPVLYAGGDQINAIVPADMPVGVYALTVGMPFFGTVPVAVDVIERWPGLFSGALNQDGTVNSESNPASLGSVVSLFGNGFGPEPLPVIEPFITSTTPNVAQGMEVLYAGRAPGTPDGIFQVNARIPLNAQTGRVPVRLVLRIEQGFLQTPLGYIWIR